MAKFKRPRAAKEAAPARGALPCIILIVLGFALAFLVFYLSLKVS